MTPSVRPRWKEFFPLLFGESPKPLGFRRLWMMVSLPGVLLWGFQCVRWGLPGREWLAGTVALLAMTAWVVRVSPRPPLLGLLMGTGLATVSLATPLWAPQQDFWLYWTLFFAAAFWTARMRDARLALAVWSALWGALSISLPSIWWAALMFAVAPPPSPLGSAWARRGACAAAVGLLLMAWARGALFPPGVLVGWDLQDWLWDRGFLAPVLLAWLGVAFAGKKSPLPWWTGQIAGWTLACGWFGILGPSSRMGMGLGLVWLSAAGFGIAALQKDLMGRAWHDRVLWVTLVIVLWAAY